MTNRIDKKTRLINEICHNGNLKDYRNCITEILTTILDSGCNVSTRYDVEYSNIEQSREKTNHIRVSMKNVTHPLNIIWSLLHEYGHFLSGARKQTDSITYREELAWCHANKLRENYPQLINEIDSFSSFKSKCLESYYKEYGNSTFKTKQ